MVGLINEIEAENGFAWNARLIMFEKWYASMGDAAEKNPMFRDYRYNPERVEEVRSTTRDFLDHQRWNRTGPPRSTTELVAGISNEVNVPRN